MIVHQSNQSIISVSPDNSIGSASSVVSFKPVVKGIVVSNSKREKFVLPLNASTPSLSGFEHKRTDKNSKQAIQNKVYDEQENQDEKSLVSELTEVTEMVTEIPQPSVISSIPQPSVISSEQSQADRSSDLSDQSTASDSSQTFYSETTVQPLRQKLLCEWQDNQVSLEGRRHRSMRLLREKYQFPNGLARQMCLSVYEFPLRVWLVDNSGSMNVKDGTNYISKKGRSKQSVTCSRWEELKQCVKYHVNMAVDLEAPTLFRFLIDPALTTSYDIDECHQNNGFYVVEEESRKSKRKKWSITLDGTDELTPETIKLQNLAKQQANHFTEMLDQIHPQYSTKSLLCKNINEIYKYLEPMRETLELNHERVCIVIATDTIPDDNNEFYSVLKRLITIPCWIVVRVCTGDDETKHYWKTLDLDFDVQVDVVGDFTSEAREVKSCNPWINYAFPLHIAREWGFHRRILDLMDEVHFTVDQMREFCSLIFGVLSNDLTPENWDQFYYDILALLEREDLQWNPLVNSYMKWIDMGKLGKVYGGRQEKLRRRKRQQRLANRKAEFTLSSLPEEHLLNFDNNIIKSQSETNDDIKKQQDGPKQNCCSIS